VSNGYSIEVGRLLLRADIRRLQFGLSDTRPRRRASGTDEPLLYEQAVVRTKPPGIVIALVVGHAYSIRLEGSDRNRDLLKRLDYVVGIDGGSTVAGMVYEFEAAPPLATDVHGPLERGRRIPASHWFSVGAEQSDPHAVRAGPK